MAQYKVFMHEFKFVKMNGLGNDFVVIDQRVSEFDLSEEQIKLICNRTDGVGSVSYTHLTLPTILLV